jgi:hypothetical protein
MSTSSFLLSLPTLMRRPLLLGLPFECYLYSSESKTSSLALDLLSYV